MNDDWRLRIDLHETGVAHRLSELLTAEELEHDLDRSFHDRVVVSVDGPEMFCYTGTRPQAERAEELIRRLAEQHGWDLGIELTHWHPTAELWEPADVRDPETAEDREYEREGRVARERRESAERGYPEFEVRVQCPSRGQAGELSDKLDREGVSHLHRWSYLLIGATDEDSAQALAERLRTEAPAGTTVTVERNQRAIYDELPRSPFSVLGGLGA
jgi:nucleotide-binding universal stress UspA family protein